MFNIFKRKSVDTRLCVEYSFASKLYSETQKKVEYFDNKEAFLNWLSEQREFIRSSCNDFAMSYRVIKSDTNQVLYSKTI